MFKSDVFFNRSYHYSSTLSDVHIFAVSRPRVPFTVRFYGRLDHNNKTRSINAGFLIVRASGARVFSRYFWYSLWRERAKEVKKSVDISCFANTIVLFRLAQFSKKYGWQVYDHYSWHNLIFALQKFEYEISKFLHILYKTLLFLFIWIKIYNDSNL